MNANDPPAPIRPVGHSCEAAPIRTAPRALWRVARAVLHTLHMLFGDPAAVATRHTLTAQAHAHMASWLRCAEAMLRRLLLIEASAIAKPNVRPLLHPRRARTRKPMSFQPEKPEDWRVRFNCFEPGPRAPRRSTPGVAAAARRERLAKLGALPGQPVFVYRVAWDTHPPPRKEPASPVRRRTPHASPRPHHSTQDKFWVHERDLKPLRFHSAWPLAERYEALIRVFNDPAPYARRLAKRLHATPHRVDELFRAPPETWDRVEGFSLAGRLGMHRWRMRRSSA